MGIMIKIKNLAIIAHVDHGKTTLVDNLLTQSGVIQQSKAYDRMMDSGDLERERGITILAKCTSVLLNDYKINIIDTPGHADFGGEVERVLSMVDGVLLLVDAAEGPMPQTKFVLTKALKLGLKPIVILNKIDKPTARPVEVVDEIFDLFVSMGATDEQLDFKILYASGKQGWATHDLKVPSTDLKPIFDVIIETIDSPSVDVNAPFKMLVTILDYDQYLGRILIGKIYSGSVKKNMNVKSMNLEGQICENSKITKLLTFEGLSKVPVDEAMAGDIIAVAGLETTKVADTICAVEVTEPVLSTPVDPPTISITVSVNNSPFAGTSGDKVTSRLIRDRLLKEAEANVAITFKESEDKDSFEIGGRGELQLGVLFETMRREGYEICVSRPKVLFKTVDGVKFEPIEEVQVDVDEEFSGTVIEKISSRGGEIKSFDSSGFGKKRLIFTIPTKNIIGYQSELLSDTRGTAVMNKTFKEYAPFKDNLLKRKNGVLISMADGVSAAYALANLEPRGELYIKPQDKVYIGMIVGLHNLSNDLEVNPTKGKQLTNMRTTMKDEAIKLKTVKELTIEDSIAFLEEDEMLEITPAKLRLRKKYLDPHVRKKMSN